MKGCGSFPSSQFRTDVCEHPMSFASLYAVTPLISIKSFNFLEMFTISPLKQLDKRKVE
jgi:hypothetical protein